MSTAVFLVGSVFGAIAQERTQIYIGTSAIHSPRLFPLFVAEQKGMFNEQDFESAPVYMVPRVQIPVLIAKEIPYVKGLGSVLSGAVRGLPVKLVMVFMAHSPQVLVSRAQIRSVGELRGRSVGATQSGVTEHRFLLLILKKYRIDPQEVKVVSLRETPNRILAVKEGIVDAGVLDVFSGLRLKSARTAFDAYRGLWSKIGLTSDEGLRNVAALGGVPENTPVEKLADCSILKDALASIKAQ